MGLCAIKLNPYHNYVFNICCQCQNYNILLTYMQRYGKTILIIERLLNVFINGCKKQTNDGIKPVAKIQYSYWGTGVLL